MTSQEIYNFKSLLDKHNVFSSKIEMSDSLTNAKVLQEIYSYVKKLCEQNECTMDEVMQKVDTVLTTYKEEISAIIDNEFALDKYSSQVNSYIASQIHSLLSTAFQYVEFTLSEDGHFVVNFPEELNFTFDTILDTQSEDYGKLLIRY